MILTLVALFLQFPASPANLGFNLNLKALLVNAAPAIPAASSKAPEELAAPAAESVPIPDPASELASRAGLVPTNLPAGDSRAAAVSLSMPILSAPISRHSFERPSRRKWLALSMAEHSAATFDAWSTRSLISTGQFQEMNPTLRPFAGNASLYGAIQVAPLAFDYLSRRMMTSQHEWLRHLWWLPQAISTVVSLGSGAHNVSLR